MDPTDPEPAAPPGRAPLPDPTAVRRLGLRLFLLSLSAFFAAGLVAYAVSRATRPVDTPPAGLANLPASLWLSTLLLLLAGMAVEGAAQCARRARLPQVGRWLRVALALGVLFAAAQTVGMVALLRQHEMALTTRAVVGLHGLTFSLILIHAAHVLGGLVLLAVLAVAAALGRLSLQHLPAVRSAATYWHFLEVVWVAMLLAFCLYL